MSCGMPTAISCVALHRDLLAERLGCCKLFPCPISPVGPPTEGSRLSVPAWIRVLLSVLLWRIKTTPPTHHPGPPQVPKPPDLSRWGDLGSKCHFSRSINPKAAAAKARVCQDLTDSTCGQGRIHTSGRAGSLHGPIPRLSPTPS